MIEIVGFNKKYSEQFFMLNKAWIEESWHLEDSDKKDLLYPDQIFENGGQVFFALKNKIAIGTVAMIKNSDDRFELAKMTVQDDFRGKGIANMLMDECLKFAKENKAKEIFLISNKSLRIARNLYDKYGFKEVKLDSQKYLRGNVKMSLKITINYLASLVY
ncbi:MAG: GNAT family N-acetyltransferase [Candidatus Marinimicrobia bacterium]|nr:GNAT family N-acetyltransferase [Candidatus Neomarinimicrobiota bacterium]MDA1364093.1 GNAT family N-acetyltransferase [Candidatus Neomarinimicrobiota bacterium]